MKKDAVASDVPGRKAAKKRALEAVRSRLTGRVYLDWKTHTFITAQDLAEIGRSLGLNSRKSVDLKNASRKLCLFIELACERACMEAAKETRAQLARRYRGVANDIFSALEKLHYPMTCIDENEQSVNLIFQKENFTIDSMRPYIERLGVSEFTGLDHPAVSLATIGLAAKLLAKDIERGECDLAHLQGIGYAGDLSASDRLIFALILSFRLIFEDKPMLSLDGERNENSPLLRWVTESLAIVEERVALALKTTSSAASALRMIRRISEHENPKTRRHSKKATSLIARLSKINTEVGKCIVAAED